MTSFSSPEQRKLEEADHATYGDDRKGLPGDSDADLHWKTRVFAR
jgi:hypothetical protein